MSNNGRKNFKYYACAIPGWFMIPIGILTMVLAIAASGDTEARLRLGGVGFGLAAAGILLVRRVEKNIFKALEEVFLLIV